MIIYFIRHADPDYANDCLTSKGLEQGKILSERFKNFKIDEVYYSPQGRAKQTGDFCMKYFNIKPEIKNWLREIEWGDLSGDAYSTASPWSKNDMMLETDHAYPKGDSWKTDPRVTGDRVVGDVEERIRCFDMFMEEHGLIRNNQGYNVTKDASDKTIVFFCHGGLSSVLISHLLNIPFWQFCAHFDIDVTGISKIMIDESKTFSLARSSFINNYTHLWDD